ncbi:hypothetical protein [Demequina sp.]|uniref:hypothetical protein n=1 Tax=Demequina sp. TaxID=2050685 RepID=UPI003D10E879
MTISADLIKDAPAWAVDYEHFDGEPGWFVRNLDRRPINGVYHETDDMSGPTRVALAPQIVHEPQQGDQAAETFILVSEFGVKFRDVAGLRSLAFALNAAADEAAKILSGAK